MDKLFLEHDLDGFFFIDKPEDMTSAQALNRVKKKLKLSKFGHAGTLDPFATGLLISASGQATRLISLFQDLNKTYEAVFVFGEETDSADKTGSVIQRYEKIPDLQEIQNTIPRFTGVISQIPPVFSALHVNGTRAYELARRGEKIDLAPREVEILAYDILDYRPPELTVRITCGSGTYIRSLARDLGHALQTGAFVKTLRRTHIGDFSADQGFFPENMEPSCLIPFEEALKFIPALAVKEEFVKGIQNGIPFQGKFLINLKAELKSIQKIYRLVTPQGRVIALLKEGRYFWVRPDSSGQSL